MRCLVSFLLLALLFGNAPDPAASQVYETETGYAAFTSSVPLHTFTGESEHLVGRIDLEESKVDFYLDLETLRTGIGKRDRDMRETLQTDQHPFAEFFGTLVSSFDPDRSDVQPARVQGEFTIHGVTRQVEIEGTLQRTDEGLRVRAEWTLELDDYDITPPSLLVVRVDETQHIEIDALLEPVDE